MARIAPLCILEFEEFGSFTKYKWPLDLLLDFGFERYNVLLCHTLAPKVGSYTD